MLTNTQIALLRRLPELGILDWSRMFILKSGKESPIYANWRLLRGNPKAMELAVEAGEELMDNLEWRRLGQFADIPTGVTPFVATLCYRLQVPQISPHPPKTHGQPSTIDGIYKIGDRVSVWDDVATTGVSMIDGIKILTDAGLNVLRDVYVIMDRGQGAKEALAELGYNLHSILTLSDSMYYYRESGDMTPEKYLEINEFLKSK